MSTLDAIDEINSILNSFETKLRADFEVNRTQSLNPNVKGGGYEKAVSNFLQPYFDPLFKLYTRVKLIDFKFEYVSKLKTKSEKGIETNRNEWDVVGLYRTTIPQLVLETQGTYTLPYDGIGFVIEVAQDGDSSQVQDDINHLRMLASLSNSSPNVRWQIVFARSYLDRPLRVLFYGKALQRDNLLKELNNSLDAWDLCLVFDRSELYLNY